MRRLPRPQFLLSLGAPLTREELRARILTALNESPTSPVFWSAAEINDVIDEGAEVICEEAGAVKRTHFLPMLPGCTYYSLQALGPRVQSPWRIWDHTRNHRLETTSMAELDERLQIWHTVSEQPWNWFSVSWDTFGIFPHPLAGGGILRVDTLEWPRALQDDDDEPELMAGDADALVAYGLADGSAKQWDPQTLVMAWTLFVQRITGAVDRTGAGAMQSRAWQVGSVGDVAPISGLAV